MLAEDTIASVLKEKFPGHQEDYYFLLVSAIQSLSTVSWNLDKEHHRDAVKSAMMQDVFFEPLRYYQAILGRWPKTMLTCLEQSVKTVRGFEEYLRAYQRTHFSTFLCNTKMLIVAYPLAEDWEQCYEEWVAGSARQIQPIVGLNTERTYELVRPIVNEVIVHPGCAI